MGSVHKPINSHPVCSEIIEDSFPMSHIYVILISIILIISTVVYIMKNKHEESRNGDDETQEVKITEERRQQLMELFKKKKILRRRSTGCIKKQWNMRDIAYEKMKEMKKRLTSQLKRSNDERIEAEIRRQ